MSIDQRLRTGLAGNTEHLVPDLDRELRTTYGRARRRQRVRRGGVALAAVAAAAVLAWVVDLPDLRDDAVPVTPNPRAPTDLRGLDGPLEPGLYSMAAWGESDQTGPLPRAILDVPEGYFSNGGYDLDAGRDGVTDDQFGQISVWHATHVLTDPCRRHTADRGRTDRRRPRPSPGQPDRPQQPAAPGRPRRPPRSLPRGHGPT